MQDQRSESQIALETAVERMLADMAAIPDRSDDHAQPGAAEETAPAVHIVKRTGMHTPHGRA